MTTGGFFHFTWIWHFTSIAWVFFHFAYVDMAFSFFFFFFHLQCIDKSTDDIPLIVTVTTGHDGKFENDAAVYDCDSDSLNVASTTFRAHTTSFCPSFCITKLCIQRDSHRLHLFQSMPEQALPLKVDPLISVTLSGVWAMVVWMYYLLECEAQRERWKSSKTSGKNG